MSKKAKKNKNQVAHHRAAGNQTAVPTTNEQALVSPRDEEDNPTTSPYRLMAALFGIPMAVLIAAVAFRMLSGS